MIVSAPIPAASAITRRSFVAVAGSSWILAHPLAAQGDEFRDVPNAYRMRMHWWVLGPAWTAEEAARQLAEMGRAQLGGVLIFPAHPIAVDDPARGIRNQPYLSPEFLSVLRSVTGAARKLGLTVDIVLGTGWPYGGPSVTPAQSAHMLRLARIPVDGATVRLPARRDGEEWVGVFHVDRGRSILLAPGPEGEVASPSSRGEIQVFTSAPTRMQVKRASLGAEGLVVDHLNEGALQSFLHEVGDKLLSVGGIRSIFCDSLEVYRTSWTRFLPEMFRSRRGYDLIPYLPALFDASNPDARDVRCDYWRTISDLAAEAFIDPLAAWAHSRGVTLQAESYGTPPVSLASYRNVDIPVGEHYEWMEFSTSRWASSGAHLAGKRTILAEAWTWTGLPNRFADTMEQLKRCSDLHFLCGINALYGLTYAYSPIDLGVPGWVPYFGPAVNHTNPFWPHFSHLVQYVNRASYVLQQGSPVADIAVYLAAEDSMAEAGTEHLLLNWAVRDRLSSNGAPPEFRLKNALFYQSDLVKTIITNGYSFDGIDTFSLREGIRIADGRLRKGDGDYAVIVLPNLTGIDLESLRQIAAFVRDGGTVIATRRLPGTSWGVRDREQNRSAVRALTAELFGEVPADASLHEQTYGKGRAIFVSDELGSLREALRRRPPDILWREPSPHVSFVHRRAGGLDFYFVVNTSEQPEALDGRFNVGKRAPEVWDLMTGDRRPSAVFEPEGDGVRLRFTLGPLESRVFAFGEPRAPLALESNLDPDGAGSARVFENGEYFLRRPGGRRTVTVSGIPAPRMLSPRWRLRFDKSSIAPLVLDELRSWTEIPDARFFSGRGMYEAEFELSAKPEGVVLDLGAVRETAEVVVNGQPAGIAWMRPYRRDITHLVRRGVNRLRIDVTNLLINTVLGDGPIDYSAVYARYGNRFPAGDEWSVVRDPLPSGLLGPVRLVFYKVVTVRRS